MNIHTTKTNKLNVGYSVLFTLIIIIPVLYAIYVTYGTNSKIKDNTIVENDNSINIYKEGTVTNLYELASYTTTIHDNDKNRIHNINLACKNLNGHIVHTDKEFSFNTVLGKMNQQAGYKKALGFDSNGNKIKMYGGGICQLSSTLYNAVLIAKLQVTERHAHSRRVNYVPKNKDATIYYGGPDFKFINNTNNDIIIYTNTDGSKVTVTLKTIIN